jgi:hypothetical protein
MSQTVLEQIGDQIDETAHKATRAASAVSDAFEDSVQAAKRAAKRGGHVATELLDDTVGRVRRHPIKAVLSTFAVGIAAGAAIVLSMKRKQL